MAGPGTVTRGMPAVVVSRASRSPFCIAGWTTGAASAAGAAADSVATGSATTATGDTGPWSP